MRWPRYNGHLPHDLAERGPLDAGDGKRSRRADIAYVVALATALTLLALVGPLETWANAIGSNDFSKIWAGPRALLVGSDPYDPATWEATAVRLGTAPPDTAVYLYPPWVAVALLPFAALPLATATVLWTLGGFAAAALALRALLRAVLPGQAWAHGLAGFVLLFSPPGFVTLITGQWTFLLLAAVIAMILLLRNGHPAAAGLVAVAMLAKPQLFVFTAPALALRATWPVLGRTTGDRRFLLVACGAALAVIGLSWAFVPQWWPAWLHGVGEVQVESDPVTISTALRWLLGATGVWLAPVVLLGAVTVGLSFDPRSDAWLPVWLALSSAETVYSNTYDLLLLLVPLVLAAGALSRGPAWKPIAVLLSGALTLIGAMLYLHQGDARHYTGLVPLGVFALSAALLWPQRRRLDDRSAVVRAVI